MKYTKIPDNTSKNLQLNAGIIVDDFNPATGVIGNIIGATSGGINFTDSVSTIDMGDDIDNCPKNTMELKKIDSREVKMAGTFVSITAALVKTLSGMADIDEQDETHVIPRDDILVTDFKTYWFIGDYSDVNTGESAGYLAIKIMNAYNTSGFAIQTGDKAKGQFAFEFTAHYSMADQTKVPYEIYVKQGGAEPTPSVLLNTHAITLTVDDTYTLTATTVPAGETVTYTSSSDTYATVTSGGIVSAEAAGSAIITASITVDGVAYTDTCTVVVEAAPTP